MEMAQYFLSGQGLKLSSDYNQLRFKVLHRIFEHCCENVLSKKFYGFQVIAKRCKVTIM